MRVLISAYNCDPFGGSEGGNAWFTAEGLARAGADVHILAQTADKDRTEAAILAYSSNPGPGRLSATYFSDSVPTYLDAGQLGVYARYAAWQLRAHRWARNSGRGRWDVGHHISWGSLTHPVGIGGCPFPVVVGPVGGGQSLDPEHERWLDGNARHDRGRRVALRRLVPLNPVSRYVAGGASLVLATNHESADLARQLGARRVRLALAEGVRANQLRDGAPAFPPEPHVVWIGRFLPLKAAGLALAAFRLAARRIPDARLTFVGDGPTRVGVEAAARDLVDEGRVRFAGRLPWAEAQQVLGQARVHLFTSVRDSFGAQTVEAAALGVPTVALDAFGSRAFLHRSGFRLVDPQPGETLHERFADALVEVLGWPAAQWRAQSEGALGFASEHLYRDHAERLIAEYRQILA